MESTPVAVIGAGPYGLSAAAHLRQAKLGAHVFGSPMSFWTDRMPAGMLLRSGWDGSHIGDPDRRLTLDAFQAESGRTLPRPVPLEDFVAYGRWFAERAVPEVDGREVVHLERRPSHFALALSDGATMTAERVVVATGINSFARVPQPFQGLPEGLASHSSAHRSFAPFEGRDVLVVGGGQSALESAALLHEAGARVEVVVRRDQVNWLTHGAGSRLNRALQSRRNPLRPLLFPPSEIGPVGVSLVVDRPALWTHLPTEDMRAAVTRRALRPAGAQWLRARLEAVPIRTGTEIACSEPHDGRLHVRLSDGTARDVDHLLLATGYEVDVRKTSWLGPGLLRALRVDGGYPVLSSTLESSVPGLHFVGAAASRAAGPLVRFVAGTGYAARAVLRGMPAAR